MQDQTGECHDICSHQSIWTPWDYIFRSNLSHEIPHFLGFRMILFWPILTSFLILFFICGFSMKNLLVWTSFPNPVLKFGWRRWIFPLVISASIPSGMPTDNEIQHFDNLIDCHGLESRKMNFLKLAQWQGPLGFVGRPAPLPAVPLMLGERARGPFFQTGSPPLHQRTEEPESQRPSYLRWQAHALPWVMDNVHNCNLLAF